MPHQTSEETPQNQSYEGKEIDANSPEMDDVLADIECLARSHNRLAILDQLRHSSLSIAELTRDLDIPRTSLRRNLTELENKYWIRTSPTDDVYRITLPGQIFVQQFRELLSVAQLANNLGSFLDQLPTHIPIEAEHLRNCRITCSQRYNPRAPKNRLLDILDTPSFLRGVTPVICPMHIQKFANRAENSHEFEVITNRDAIKALQTRHPSLLDTLVNTDAGSLFFGSELPLYEIYLVNDIIAIATYDENRRIHSVLEVTNRTDDIVNWAEEKYNSHIRTAEPYDENPT